MHVYSCWHNLSVYLFLSVPSSKLYGDQAKFFEMETTPRIKHKKKGALSMVNNGDNLHGSQVGLALLVYS